MTPTEALIQRLGVGLDAFQYAAMRNVFGVAALWLMVLFLKHKTRYSRADLCGLILGGIGTAAFMPFYTLGFQRAGVAIAAIVAIGSAPIFTGIIARVLFKRTPTKPWFVGTGMAVLGVALMNAPSGDTEVHVAGVLFASVCGLAYAFQATGMEMLSKRRPSSIRRLTSRSCLESIRARQIKWCAAPSTFRMAPARPHGSWFSPAARRLKKHAQQVPTTSVLMTCWRRLKAAGLISMPSSQRRT